MPTPAYIYGRFSSAEQAKGSSLARQLQDGRAYLAAIGLEHATERELVDEGRSAYHGTNRTAGSALHAFEQDALAGKFSGGVVLAVENIDRLTRQGWEEATDLLRSLTANGVTVVTWQTGERFEAHQRIDMARVMGLVMKAEVAREESDKKSKRLKAAWRGKVEAATNGAKQAITGMMPGWLEVDPETGEPRAIEHRVAVLNEVYDWYIAGKGLPWIARRLNERKEPNWGRGKQAGKGWNVSTLHKYLTNRAVLGELQPKQRVNGGDGRVARGTTLPNYYPQVVATEKFNRVQVVRKQRKTWGGKNQLEFPNLFTGIARCGECLGPMHMTGRTKVGQTRTQKRRSGNGVRTYTETKDRSYLTCRNARRSFGCTSSAYHRYEPLEDSILKWVWTIAATAEPSPPSVEIGRLKSQQAELQRLVAIDRDNLDHLLSNLMEVHSKALAQKVADTEAEIEAKDMRLGEVTASLHKELAKPSADHDLQKLAGIRAQLQAVDPEVRHDARMRVHQTLRSFIDLMECEATGNTTVIAGRFGVGFTFDREGTCSDLSLIGTVASNVRYEYQEEIKKDLKETKGLNFFTV